MSNSKRPSSVHPVLTWRRPRQSKFFFFLNFQEMKNALVLFLVSFFPPPAHFSLSPGSERHPLPLTSLSVPAANGTPHHHRRRPPMDTAQNPATSSTERHPRVPTDNAHQIRPRASHRPPPTSTINSGHKVLRSDDPSPDPTTKRHLYRQPLSLSRSFPPYP
jgi:hypothetical protein